MRAFKCDICGSLYEHVSLLETDNDVKIDNYNFYISLFCYPYEDQNLDVCPECKRAIVALINSRKKEV